MVLKENVTKIVCLCENVGQTGQESTNYFEIEEDLKTGSSTIYCQDTLDTDHLEHSYRATFCNGCAQFASSRALRADGDE